MAEEQDNHNEMEMESGNGKFSDTIEAIVAGAVAARDIYEQETLEQTSANTELRRKYTALKKEHVSLKTKHSALEEERHTLQGQIEHLEKDNLEKDEKLKHERGLVNQTLQQVIDLPAVLKERDELIKERDELGTSNRALEADSRRKEDEQCTLKARIKEMMIDLDLLEDSYE